MCRSLFFALLLLPVFGSSVVGCTIPVFRYALDRWEPDAFELVLPQAAAGDSALSDLLRPLRANGKANLAIVNATAAGITQPELRTARLGGQKLWSGPLDSANLALLLDSPARQALVQHILAGDSVVWVIAEDGSPQDAAEAERVEKRLKFLEQVAALPIQNPDDPDSQLGPGPPLRLKFTSLRLRRDDPAEALLLKMLAGPASEIDPTKQSFAAAVFGRGRVLGAWPLTTLDNANLEDACLFLVGRCSCRVKDQNPGWDILLDVDWDTALKQSSRLVSAPSPTPSPTLAPAAATAAAAAAESKPLPQPDVFVTTQVSPPSFPWERIALVAVLLGGGLFLLLGPIKKR
jgi:hypothetical protein